MEVIKEDFYVYLTSIIGLDVNDKTMFFDGVGMDGLDAWTFMETIAEQYNIDLSEYKWEEYHDSEADIANFLKGLKYLFKKRVRQSQFSALHLHNVVKARKWFSPE
jgi:hypothetical protein